MSSIVEVSCPERAVAIASCQISRSNSKYPTVLFAAASPGNVILCSEGAELTLLVNSEDHQHHVVVLPVPHFRAALARSDRSLRAPVVVSGGHSRRFRCFRTRTTRSQVGLEQGGRVLGGLLAVVFHVFAGPDLDQGVFSGGCGVGGVGLVGLRHTSGRSWVLRCGGNAGSRGVAEEFRCYFACDLCAGLVVRDVLRAGVEHVLRRADVSNSTRFVLNKVLTRLRLLLETGLIGIGFLCFSKSACQSIIADMEKKKPKFRSKIQTPICRVTKRMMYRRFHRFPRLTDSVAFLVS